MQPQYINNANILKKEMHVMFFQIMDRVVMKWGNFVQKGCNVRLMKTLSLTDTASKMEVGSDTNYVYLISYYLSDSTQIASKFSGFFTYYFKGCTLPGNKCRTKRECCQRKRGEYQLFCTGGWQPKAPKEGICAYAFE